MARPAVAVLEYHLAGYRRVWRGTVFSSFVIPVLFFLGMGVMVGDYVDRGGGLALPYLPFIGTGLIAFTGVQIAMVEASFPVMGGFQWHRTYYGMAAAPPRPRDIVAGLTTFIGLRVAVAAAAFLAVMTAFGAVGSGWAVVTPLIAVLVGLSVATPMAAYAATVTHDNLIAVMFRFALLPMMLFSGVFFPVAQLPEPLRPAAYALPLWHGVELCRAAATELTTAWPVAAHLGYLTLWAVGGYLLAVHRFHRRLVV